MPTSPPVSMPSAHLDTDRQSTSIGGRDVGKVSFSGLAEPCAIGSLVEVVINAQGATQGSVLVEAIAPTGKVHRCQVHQRANTYTATFTPNEVGEWQIAIMYDSEHIRGSPFVCHVYDANLVRVYGLDVGVVGQELKFNVNSSHAGRGDVQVQVSYNGRSIPCYVEKQGPHLYRVQFTPDGAGHYKIHVYFNNMEVKGSPFSLDIVDASSVSVYGDNLRMASVDKLATFMIHAVGADSKDLTVTINAPSGKKKRARVVPVGDSTYRVEWKPVEAGEHYIDVRLYNQTVQDGPFSCNVGDPELVTVRNMPAHLKHTDLGESHSFEIDASAAGSGNLEILINGGRVSCKVKELGNRLYLATFVPVHPVTHIVEMRFNGEPVKGNPWRIEVSLPSGSTETQSNVVTALGSSAGFPLGSVILAAPINFPGGTAPITNYAAYLTGNFQTTMAGSPANTMTTFSSEIERISEDVGVGSRIGANVGGPMWAEIQGRGLTSASVGKVSSFEIGGRGVNVDDIIARITDPSGKEVPARVIAARTGNFRVEYVTADVGSYRIDLSVAGRPVDGSPFHINSYSPQRVFIDPIPGGAVGQPVQFFVDANQAGKGQLEISVNEGRVPNNVQIQGTGRCLVTFIPENSGTYVIEVTFNGELVRGCPIRVEIYDQDGSSTGLKEHRTTSVVDASSRFRPSPTSPTRTGRGWSPSSAAPGNLGSSSTSYTYERREYASGNAYTNGDRGTHTSSLNYYMPGQPVTVQLTPVTTTTTTVTSTTSAVPPAPPPPPPPAAAPSIQFGGKPLTKTWQQKSTPIDSSLSTTTQMETKRFESIPIGSETKSIYQQHLSRREPTPTRDDVEVKQLTQHQQHRNGSAIYDRGLTISPARDRGQSPSAPVGHGYRQKYSQSISTVETHHQQQDFSLTGPRVAGYGSPEKAREYEEMQRPAADRFYKYETEIGTAMGGTAGRMEESNVSVSRKYYDRQQTPSKSPDEPSFRSEFEERLARRAADREDKYSAGDFSKMGATTVASYGVDRQNTMGTAGTMGTMGTGTAGTMGTGTAGTMGTGTAGTMGTGTAGTMGTGTAGTMGTGTAGTGGTVGYRRPTIQSGDTQVVHVLRPEPELQPWRGPLGPDLPEMPVSGDTGVYATIEREPKTKEGRMIRDIPIQREKIETKQQDPSSSWSGSPSSEIEEQVIHERIEDKKKIEPEQLQRAGSTVEKGAKVDIRKLKVEFPEISEAGGGIAIVRLRKSSYFEIKPAIFDKSDLKVNLVTPSKSSLDHRILETPQGVMVEYTPVEVGTHKVHLQIQDENLLQSPCIVKVYDPDRIQVTGIESGTVTNPVQFTVDATNAGYGSLEIAIKDSEGNIIPSKVNAVQDSTSKFNVSFVPEKVDDYGIHVSFNQEPLKGSPFITNVKESDTIREVAVGPAAAAAAAGAIAGTTGTISSVGASQESMQRSTQSIDQSVGPVSNGVSKSGPPASSTSAKLVGDDHTKEKLLKLAPVGKTAVMLATGVEKTLGRPKVEVKGPNGKQVPVQVDGVAPGTYRIEFEPQVVGDHVVDVTLGDGHVEGSPFTSRVYDSRKIKVGVIPNGTVGKPVHFVVDAGEAGVGNLEVAVNEGRIPSMAHGLGQHRYDISFIPKEQVLHSISVRFNNEPVPGSPFACKVAHHGQITASGPGLERVSVKKPVSFHVDTQGAPPSSLQVLVKDSTGQEVPSSVSGSHEKGFKVEYTPQIVGNHSIDIRYGDTPIQHNPFMVKAYDASRVKLFPVEGNAVGKTSSFQIDAAKAGAGNMEIVVSVDGRNVPNFVTPEGNAKFKVSFTPQEAKQHVISVKFNGESVPGSPMISNVTEEQSSLLVVGEGLTQAMLGKPASFVVHAADAAEHDCNVVVTAPSRKLLPYQMKKSTLNSSHLEIRFIPVEIGPHLITVEMDRYDIKMGPFQCNVFDPARVKVQSMMCGMVGKVTKITVDISKAGDGVITADVLDKCSNRRIPCAVIPIDMGSSYEIAFTPTHATTLAISVLFNSIEIGASPILCEIFDPCRIKASGSGLNMAQVGEVSRFVVDLGKDGHEENLVVAILGPSKRLIPTSKKKLPDCGDSKYLIEYIPEEVGSHCMEVQFCNHTIRGSPFSCEVFHINRVKVIGVKDGRVRKEQMFQINCMEAGRGYVDVIVRNKHSVIPCTVTSNVDGLFYCTFTPRTAGRHLIDIKFNGLTIPASPLALSIGDSSCVYAQGRGLITAAIGSISHFTVFMTGAGRGECDAIVTAPDGGAVPVKCFQQKDGNFRVEYTPTSVGPHRVEIMFGEQPINGSPYMSEVFDPNHVMIQADPQGSANQPTAVRIVRKNAGSATLAVQVSDPNGKLLPVEVVPVSHNEDEIRFTPTAPGQYQISVTYGGYDVANSPIPVLFNVDEPSMPSAYGDGLSRAVVNDQASFLVDVKKLKGELKVDVTDQNGQRVKHSVRKKADGLYETVYTPYAPGRYVVTLMWNNSPLAGSPFLVPVLDPRKVLISSASMEKTEAVPIRAGIQQDVKVDASSAGPGKLRAEVRGPSGKMQAKVEEQCDGQYKVAFTPTQEGEHALYLYWSDSPISSSPVVYWAERGTGEPVTVAALGTSPQAAISKESAKRSKKEGGADSGSLGKDTGGRGSEPGKVVVNVDWVRKGALVGQEMQATIDARQAGPGELTAQCVGPNKLAYCELYGRRDGTYTLQFKPVEPGKHYLHVKYDGEHVPGSPFSLSVSSPPDPSKVRVYGPGIEHGILSKFKSDFTVDTQGAGAGQLTVRVRGPKGAFNVEMLRESKYDRLIRCKYEPKEPGDYQIEVKWAGEHVPGSPFMVMILDTQQELERFLSGQPVSPSPPLPFLPPGWVGPPPPGVIMPSPGTPPSHMMPASPAVSFRPAQRAISYGAGPAFPVYSGGSPPHRHQNGF